MCSSDLAAGGGQPPPPMDPNQMAAGGGQPPMPPPPGGDPNAAGGGQDPTAMLQDMIKQIVVQTLQEMGVQPGQQQQAAPSQEGEDPTGFGGDAHGEKADRETTKAKVDKLQKQLDQLCTFLGIPTAQSYPLGGGQQPEQPAGFGAGAGGSAPLDPSTMQGMGDTTKFSAAEDSEEDKPQITKASKFARLKKR